MNILFLSQTFPDQNAPTRGIYNGELCCALTRAGCSVKAIAPRSWLERKKGYQPTAECIDHEVEVHFPTYWQIPKFGQLNSGQRMWNSVRGLVESIGKTWQPDLVLSYWAHPDGEAGLCAAEMFGVQSAVIVGGSDILQLPHLPGRGPKVRRVLEQSTKVLSVSDGLRHSTIDLGISPEKVVTLRQGINPERFSSQPKETMKKWLGLETDRKLLLWVGRMVPVKDLLTLLKAVKVVVAQGQDVHLCLAGDGPMKSRLKTEIWHLQLEKHVTLLGAVSHLELPKWYQAADMTVLSSVSEGLPNVLRESLACGTPFVSTDVGSIEEIASHEYSMLVPPKNPEAFATAIQLVLNGPQGEAAANFQPRSWDDTAADLLNLFSTQSVSQEALSV